VNENSYFKKIEQKVRININPNERFGHFDILKIYRQEEFRFYQIFNNATS